ncbi:hypothetical protein CAAN4_D12904 [[Candida] anglica]|uniref:PA14 domain-containing protein n=1 Tax=[Candida] anglica TaxID=148631 RepID=A0ABP0EG41_9ASCO
MRVMYHHIQLLSLCGIIYTSKVYANDSITSASPHGAEGEAHELGEVYNFRDGVDTVAQGSGLRSENLAQPGSASDTSSELFTESVAASSYFEVYPTSIDSDVSTARRKRNFGDTASSGGACSPSEQGSNGSVGFTAKFYEYIYDDDDSSRSVSWYQGGYKTTLIASTNDVTDINFDIDHSSDPSDIMDVYGKSVSQNFALELTGYFLATESGAHNLSIVVDDGGMVTFGNGEAFECCNTKKANNDGGFSVMAHWPTMTPTNATYSLSQGYYYPIKIVYNNMGGPAFLKFFMTTPSGKIIEDFTSVYSFPNKPEACPVEIVTTTIAWGEATTSTSTITGTETPRTDTIEVLTPAHEITITTPWSETYTSTRTITPTNSDGTTTIEVYTPPHVTTMTTPWSETYTSTRTITPTNSDGTTTIEVYTPPHVTTMTTPWSETYTSTQTITPTDSDGTTTIEVYTPPHVTTMTTPWSETYTSTQTITPTNSDGTTTIEVYTPPHVTTMTTPWSETYTSTQTITPTDSDGTTTIEVYTPPHVTTMTTPWSETYTSTQTITPTDSEGTTTIEVYTPHYTTEIYSTSSTIIVSSHSWSNCTTSTDSSISSMEPTISSLTEKITSTEVLTVTSCTESSSSYTPVSPSETNCHTTIETFISTITKTVTIPCTDIFTTTRTMCSKCESNQIVETVTMTRATIVTTLSTATCTTTRTLYSNSADNSDAATKPSSITTTAIIPLTKIKPTHTDASYSSGNTTNFETVSYTLTGPEFDSTETMETVTLKSSSTVSSYSNRINPISPTIASQSEDKATSLNISIFSTLISIFLWLLV